MAKRDENSRETANSTTDASFQSLMERFDKKFDEDMKKLDERFKLYMAVVNAVTSHL